MAKNYSLPRESKGLLIIPPRVSWERKNDHPYEKVGECRLFIRIILASLLILFSSMNHLAPLRAKSRWIRYYPTSLAFNIVISFPFIFLLYAWVLVK